MNALKHVISYFPLKMNEFDHLNAAIIITKNSNHIPNMISMNGKSSVGYAVRSNL